jgi:hypothetical protein
MRSSVRRKLIGRTSGSPAGHGEPAHRCTSQELQAVLPPEHLHPAERFGLPRGGLVAGPLGPGPGGARGSFGRFDAHDRVHLIRMRDGVRGGKGLADRREGTKDLCSVSKVVRTLPRTIGRTVRLGPAGARCGVARPVPG